ncbi:hypothetical protein ElyMa_003300000 [Elysia marginata]|uniref:Uncharacterized protein n=1 Tax=Elysia marginata TaxID=1093978 RepID=A0AAV4JFS1_9GAST|nr:hypothetical protein ElyMa_003300000 [Elysia marginata]
MPIAPRGLVNRQDKQARFNSAVGRLLPGMARSAAVDKQNAVSLIWFTLKILLLFVLGRALVRDPGGDAEFNYLLACKDDGLVILRDNSVD